MTAHSIPFTYEASVIRTGERRPRMVVMRDRIEVDLAEVASESAPSAAALFVAFRRARTRDHVALTLSEHAGQLWEPVLLTSAKEPPQECDRATYAALDAADAIELRRQIWAETQHIAASLNPPETEDNVREVISDNRDICAQAAMRVATQRCFIDGVLHKPSSEPVYVTGDDGKVSSDLLHRVRNTVTASRIFRADDPDVLLDYACQLPETSQAKVLDLEAISLFRTGLFQWDRRREMSLAAADLLVEKLSRLLLAAPADTVEAWLSFREARRSGDVEAIEQRFGSMVERYRSAGGGAISALELERSIAAASAEEAAAPKS